MLNLSTLLREFRVNHIMGIHTETFARGQRGPMPL